MYCHMSIYLKTTSKHSRNKIQFTDIPLYFLLQQKILEDIITADIKVNVFITCYNNLLIWFLNLMGDFTSCVSQRPEPNSRTNLL
jgi:hypothetical protein